MTVLPMIILKINGGQLPSIAPKKSFATLKTRKNRQD